MGQSIAQREPRDRDVDDRRRHHFEDLRERGVELLVQELAIALGAEVLDDRLDGRLRIRRAKPLRTGVRDAEEAHRRGDAERAIACALRHEEVEERGIRRRLERLAQDALDGDGDRAVALPRVREQLAENGLALLVVGAEMHRCLESRDGLRRVVQAVAIDEADLLVECMLQAEVAIAARECAADHALVHLLEAEPVAVLGEDAHDVLERDELRRIDVERLLVETERSAAIGELVLRDVRHRVERLRLARGVGVALGDGPQHVEERRPLAELRIEREELVEDREIARPELAGLFVDLARRARRCRPSTRTARRWSTSVVNFSSGSAMPCASCRLRLSAAMGFPEAVWCCARPASAEPCSGASWRTSS